MKHHIPFFLLLAVVLLVACGQSTETLPVQSIEQPTATLARTTATATEGVRIGITVIPPATWTPTPIKPTKTPAPTWTPLPTNTPEPTGTATPPGMAKLHPAFGGQVWSSPDGKWLWSYEAGNPEYDPKTHRAFYVTHFVSVKGDKEWKVALQPSYFEHINGLIGSEISYKPFFWMPNEPYVYLVGYGTFDGPIYFYTGSNLARLNLNTGDFSIQISGWNMHHFKFSDNAKYLLDGNLWDEKLRIIRVRDSLVIEIALPKAYPQSGDASFSPDNKLLAIQTCVENEQDDCYRFALLVVDIEAKSYQEVVPDLAQAMGMDEKIRTITSWASNNLVLLEERIYGERKEPRQWLIDVTTGNLIELK